MSKIPLLGIILGSVASFDLRGLAPRGPNPLGPVVNGFLKDTRHTALVRDDSNFSAAALLWLFEFDLSFELFRDIGQVKPGSYLLLLTDTPADLDKDYRKHEGPLYVISGILPNVTEYPEPPSLFLHSNLWYFCHTNHTSYNVDVKTLEAVEMTPEWVDKVLNPMPFEDIFKKPVIVRTFNLTIFAETGRILPNGRPEWSEGMEMSLFEEVAHRMKLNWTLQPSNGYGVRFPNGTWLEGIHFDISAGVGDVAFAQIWLTTNDIHAVDFTYPLDLHCLRFIVPREKVMGLQWYAIVKTYEWLVWTVVSGCALVATLGVKVVFRVRIKMGKESSEPSIWYILYQVITMLAQTNYPSPEKVRGSMRPMVLSWVLFSLLLSIGYCSNLVSVLTRTKYTDKLNTVEDLVRAKCRWGINGNPENDLVLKNEEDPVYVKFWKYYAGNNDRVKIKWEKYKCYAELGESNSKLFYVPKGHTLGSYRDHEASNECLVGHLITFYLKKGSPLTRPFSLLVSLIRETGVMNRIMFDVIKSERLKRYIVQNAFTPTSTPDTGQFRKLKLQSVQGPFYLLGFGILCGIVAFIFEITMKTIRVHTVDDE